VSLDLLSEGVFTLRSAVIFCVVLLIVALLPAYADFEFVRKIPAPQPESGCAGVTGLAVSGNYLFATVACDTSSFLYLLDPYDGSIIEEKELDGSPPDCPGDSVYIVSATYEGFGHYWLGDVCGDFINVIWVFDSLAVYDSFLCDSIETPTGLCYQSDTLFAVDYHDDVLTALSRSGEVLAIDTLPPITLPTALTMYRNHFFISSALNDSVIYEVSKEAALIDTHVVKDRAMAGTYPLSATFCGDLFYVGSDQDSILVFKLLTYCTYVPKGTDVAVEAVPARLEVTFDEVTDSCWICVDVAESQPCPAPDSVTFFSDIYDISTCIDFDYVAAITFNDTTDLPGPADKVRIFSRPAGGCVAFRDISVDSLEILPSLRTMSRMQSEDDEFSVFAMGVDLRDSVGIIERKFVYTDDAITSNEDSIPGAVYTEITNLLDEALFEFRFGSVDVAADLVDSLADIVRDTPDIPHTYYPGEQGHNIAGLIISSSHTLSFSLRAFDDDSGIPSVVVDMRSGLLVRPNPSNASFTIDLECSRSQQVDVSVYSVRGRLVRRLFKDKVPKGHISVTWAGDNEKGHLVSPGAYFIVAREGEKTTARKVILQR
jgi:hypothetical protein